jgi:hypothetical protein
MFSAILSFIFSLAWIVLLPVLAVLAAIALFVLRAIWWLSVALFMATWTKLNQQPYKRTETTNDITQDAPTTIKEQTTSTYSPTTRMPIDGIPLPLDSNTQGYDQQNTMPNKLVPAYCYQNGLKCYLNSSGYWQIAMNSTIPAGSVRPSKWLSTPPSPSQSQPPANIQNKTTTDYGVAERIIERNRITERTVQVRVTKE